MEYNQKRKIRGSRTSSGFTLVELIMVMVIVSVLAVGGALLMSFLFRNSIYIPNKLNTDMMASDALNIMIEGDQKAKGLRFSRRIVWTGGSFIFFINQDGLPIVYWHSTGGAQLFRSINFGAGFETELIPNYHTSATSILNRGGRMFRYYDQNENPTSAAGSIRRVRIDLIAQTGSGQFEQLDGRSELMGSVSVNRF